MLLCFLVLQTSCGKDIVAPELEQYVRTMRENSTRYGVELNSGEVLFSLSDEASLGHEVGGNCSSAGGNSKIITVNRSFWERASSADREALILHELGHCLLGRSHLAGYDFRHGRHYSLMNPSFIGGNEFKRNRDYYLSELFTRRTGSFQQ